MSPLKEWVPVFAAVTRAAVLESYQPKSCIESTRIGIEVARYFGYRGEPIPVRLAIGTQSWWDSNGQEGYSVGTTSTGAINLDTRGWDGHLVLHLAGTWLVDLSADALDRPQHGVHSSTPVVIPATMEQLADGVSVQDKSTGTVFVYKVVADQSWRNTPAWRGHRRLARVTAAAAIRSLKG